MIEKGYSLLRFGRVCEVDSSRGFARVDFDEDDITSAFLPVATSGAVADKYFSMPAVNDQVVCLMDKNCEAGAILGALYSSQTLPAGFSQNISGVIFSDGSQFTYDKGSAKFTLSNAVQNLASILSDLMDAHIAETHTTGTGPSGPPINVASYTAIKARLDLLLQ